MFNSYVSLPVGSIPLLSHYYPINPTIIIIIAILVGGFNHLEKYQWEGLSHILWKNMENRKCLKPPTSYYSYPMIFP